RDFGWIGTGEAIDRLEATLAIMSGLARFRGHFYNWYDTRDLRPLDPKYVSTVDSGNLAGHLITLANVCREWRNGPIVDAARFARAVAIERGDDAGAELLFWAQASVSSIEAHRRDLRPETEAAASLAARLSILEDTARSMALAMEFGFLLDHERKLLSIGYLVPEGALDPSCYDLLASEARLASFIAIAKGDVPASHGFRLGRGVTLVAHG